MKLFLFVLLCLIHAEQETGNKRFEVASVKASPSGARGASGGGPGTSDPERLRYGRITLKSLLSIAYGVDQDRVQGAPWIGTDAFAIDAKVPPGATKEDVPLMLQTLLRERFHLMVRIETAAFNGYELVIAKGGSKMKGSTHDSAVSAVDPSKAGQPVSTAKDSNGFPVLQPGLHYQAAISNGDERASFRDTSMAEFAKTLRLDGAPTLGGNMFSPPQIIDHTGLAGNFDFTLEFRRKPDDLNANGPDLFTALEKQLGLRLQKATAIPLQVVIVDQADRTPTEN